MATAAYEAALHVVEQLIQDLQEARLAADDACWEATFARSSDKLEVAAARVRANRVAGWHIPLEPEHV